MGFFADFKAFAMRGNVVDLAVGVIIGGAFGAIVTSLVNDVIMPPIGAITKGVDMKEQFFALNGQHYDKLAQAKAAGVAVITYGNFINATINFLIIAFVIFVVVQQVSRLFPPATPPPAGPTNEEKLLTEIRDLLARNTLPPATR